MKRLITCSDGTWDKPGIMDDGKPVESNVSIMYKAIVAVDPFKNVKQLKVYDTGVGTGYSFKDKFAGGITGLGIDNKIKNIYTFLMLNYEQGDEIYLFGFSRGAYTARSLAGFIRNCGILKPNNIALVDRAYELYRERNDYTCPDSDLMVSFRKNFCIEKVTKIKFIGVWDTVCSLGIPLPFFNKYNNERYKFHDAKLSSTIENAYHALAIDERRSLFKPTLWEKCDSVIKGQVNQQMQQVWFPGVHCNIGGGYSDTGLSDTALKRLIEKATDNGLFFDRNKVAALKPNYMGKLEKSYKFPYTFYPKIWRDVDLSDKYNASIDNSAIDRMKHKKGYKPKNIIKYKTNFG